MTVGDLMSEGYHLINGVYYYRENDSSAVVFRVEQNNLRVELPETITLPNGEILNVETIASAFSYSNIESIVIPKSVKRLNSQRSPCVQNEVRHPIYGEINHKWRFWDSDSIDDIIEKINNDMKRLMEEKETNPYV